MAASGAVVFDVGRVLHRWEPGLLYERLIPDDAARAAFLGEVVTEDWHFQHDEGRPFAETSAELSAQHPEHAELIAAWGPGFLDTLPGAVAGMEAIVAELDEGGVPLYAITNFSAEFWAPFRAREAALFDRFRDVVVSGAERVVKPDAAIFRLALERWGLAAEDCVFVDDNLANVAGARAVGMHAVAFTDAGALRAELVRLGLLG